MAFQVLIDTEESIVNVIFSGTTVIKDHYTALDVAMQHCKERNISKLLVDFSALDNKSISTVECFEFGKCVAEITQKLRIAHVLSRDSKVRENIRFVSNVEANRGKITREFENVEDAIGWLRGLG